MINVTSSAPASQRIGPTNSRLPAEVSSFVGRQGDIAEITRLLSESRVVTLTGLGGVGKTRLALRVAAKRQRAFVDGVWLVELAELKNPELLAQTIVGALRIQGLKPRPAQAMLVEYLGDKQLLLILDNCEHLLDACALLASTLVQAAPRLRILATSREPLGIRAEQTYAVSPLPLPLPGAGGHRRAGGAPSVKLFTERARQVVPGFALTEANRSSVEQICRMLDGLPLGIELAARRLRAMSLQELKARLVDRFGLLTEGTREAPQRHQTLRAVVDWSYDLCSPHEQRLWERCSVFAGRVDLAASEQVCSGDGIARGQVLDLVARLVDKSILYREQDRYEVHYRMLETVRAYGLEQLVATGHRDRWQERHRGYFRELAAVHRGQMFSSDQAASIGRLLQVHADLRIALEAFFADPDGAEDGLAMAADLLPLWISGPQIREGRHWLASGLAEVTRPCPARAQALWVSAWLAVIQGDIEAAEALLDETRTLGADLQLPVVRGYAALCGGTVAMYRGDMEAAISEYEEALAHHQAGGDPMGAALALTWMCWTYSSLGDSGDAVTAGEAALALCEEHGDRWTWAYALMALGVEMTRQRRFERAAELIRQSLQARHVIDDRLSVKYTAELLAWIAADQGQYKRAATLSGVLAALTADVIPPEYARVLRHYQDSLARTQSVLGSRAFTAAVARGAAFSYEEAVEFAMEETPATGTSASARTAGAVLHPLTPRETEVARLVGQGMSNQEIADVLTVVRKTAEAHVQSILTKLGFTNRWQIARWLEQQQELTHDRPNDGPCGQERGSRLGSHRRAQGDGECDGVITASCRGEQLRRAPGRHRGDHAAAVRGPRRHPHRPRRRRQNPAGGTGRQIPAADIR